jgi:DNA-binding transcriptional ArsR family regulator
VLPEIKLVIDSPKPISVSELARLTGKSLPVISRNLSRAKKHKLVMQLADKTYIAYSNTDTPLQGKIDIYFLRLADTIMSNRPSEAKTIYLLRLAQYLRKQADILEAKVIHAMRTGQDLSRADWTSRSYLTLDTDPSHAVDSKSDDGTPEQARLSSSSRDA